MSNAKRVNRLRLGASAIPFALALPILLATASGAVEYGHYAYRAATLSSAVRDAVQAAAVRPLGWNPGPLDVARVSLQQDLAAHGGAEGLVLDAHIDDQPGGHVLFVSASMPYRPVFGLLPTPPTVASTFAMGLSDTL